MAISFRCDCGSALEATDDFAGRTGPCPACGREVLVPNPAQFERGRRQRLLWTWFAVLVAGVGGVLALLVIARYRQSAGDTAAASVADEDPRWTFPTPFRNTRPDVPYVRDAVCAECHVDQAADFHKHPMGQSLFPVATVAGLQRYDATVRNPFQALGATFEVEREGDRVFHKEMRRDTHGTLLAEARKEVHYVIGSGVHNYSYLINRDGYLVQSPITFYSQKRIWDISPGLENYGRNLFERPVASDCLFCHTNRVAAVPDTINRYEPPIFIDGTVIGCQRCHGPGALHVERRERGEHVELPDHTIVNPRWLPSELRDGICQQCHLEGVRRVFKRGRDAFDYRPGLPWQMFWTVFTRTDHPDDSKFVGSVEQLHVSRCFKASNGKMGCTSCHEPHRFPEAAKRIDFYRGRCQNCHRERPCSLPGEKRQANGDNCIACHMPPFGSSDIPHTAVTDHRIRRKPAAPSAEPARSLPARFSLQPYLPEIPDCYQDLEPERARALIMIEEGFQQDVEMALPLLDQVLKNWPNDVPALEAKCRALLQVGRLDDAWDVCQAVLAGAPRRERALQLAALVARAMGRTPEAADYYRRLVAVNPTSLTWRLGLATALAEHNDWAEATVESEKLLQQYPPNLEVRVLLLREALRRRDHDRARKIFDELLALNHPEAARLRLWFQNQMK